MGATGPTGATGTGGLAWQQTWSNATTYNFNDGVQYQGSAYISLIDSNTGNTPGSPSTTEGVSGSSCGTSCDWSLVAAGAIGFSGTTNNGGNVVFTDSRVLATSIVVASYIGGNVTRTELITTLVSAGSILVHGDNNVAVSCIMVQPF